MKVTKAKAPLLLATLRVAKGNLWCSGMGCTAKLTTRQGRSVQTDAVSQFTKQLHSAHRCARHLVCFFGGGYGLKAAGRDVRPAAQSLSFGAK